MTNDKMHPWANNHTQPQSASDCIKISCSRHETNHLLIQNNVQVDGFLIA
jgi:hypothetical protein